MKCPNCGNRKFDVYEARGFTAKQSPIKECECGQVWRLVPEGNKMRIDVIKQGKKPCIKNHVQEGQSKSGGR